MSSNTLLNIVINAKGNAVKQLKGITKAAKGSSLALSAIGVAAGVAGTAIVALEAIAIKGTANWKEYALEVGNLRDMFNFTSEEASFLMDTMTKFGITQDTTVAVFRKLSSLGIEPTVKNLQNALYTYDSLTDATERAQYRLEMFGEQGIKQILPMWEQLTAAQKENFGIQEDGTFVTDNAIQAARDFTQAQASLKAEVQSVFQAIGLQALPVLTDLLTAFQNTGLVKAFADSIGGIDMAALIEKFFVARDGIKAFGTFFMATLSALGDKVQSWFVWLGEKLSFMKPIFEALGGYFANIGTDVGRGWDAATEPIKGYMQDAIAQGKAERAAAAASKQDSALPTVGSPEFTPLRLPTKSERKAENAELAKEIGIAVRNSMVDDALMLEDIRRMMKGLPMYIRDATARTDL